VCLKVDQRAGQLSLPDVEITKTERNGIKQETGLKPRDQSDRQKQTLCSIRFSEKKSEWHSEKVMEGDSSV